jgi:hypothetical protein
LRSEFTHDKKIKKNEKKTFFFFEGTTRTGLLTGAIVGGFRFGFDDVSIAIAKQKRDVSVAIAKQKRDVSVAIAKQKKTVTQKNQH